MGVPKIPQFRQKLYFEKILITTTFKGVKKINTILVLWQSSSAH